ncbi:MAG: sigma-70 family RNA polymerase sigma factor [Bacteroidota bacterium]
MGKSLLEKAGRKEVLDPNRLLVILAQKGDEHATYKLYTLYAKAMLNTAYRIVNNKEDAEDILQESFIKAFAKLNSFSFESTFGAWLKRIVVNHSINHINRKKELHFFDTAPEPKEHTVDIIHAEQVKQRIELLYASLHQLPDGYRTVFSLFVLEGYDHKEIAQILNISVSTSISQLSRAKQKLRTLINTSIHE